MVLFEGNEFSSIEEFDGHILSFGSEINGKCIGFFTVLPISPKDYRDEYYTVDYAKIEISNIKDFVVFNIFTDRKRPYSVRIREQYKEEIKKAINDIEMSEISWNVSFI